MSGEYLLKRIDGEWFDVGPKNFERTLVPQSLPWSVTEGQGDFRIAVRNCEIVFSHEDSGIQVVFESDKFSPEEEVSLLSEILANIKKATGQQGKLIEL